jgi:hypothetical protein
MASARNRRSCAPPEPSDARHAVHGERRETQSGRRKNAQQQKAANNVKQKGEFGLAVRDLRLPCAPPFTFAMLLGRCPEEGRQHHDHLYQDDNLRFIRMNEGNRDVIVGQVVIALDVES